MCSLATAKMAAGTVTTTIIARGCSCFCLQVPFEWPKGLLVLLLMSWSGDQRTVYVLQIFLLYYFGF